MTLDSEQSTSVENDEVYRYDDGIVRCFIWAATFWGLLASLAIAASGYILLHPDLMAPEYTFAKLSVFPLTLTVYGFAANASMAGVYFSAQRLCHQEMWSKGLSYVHFLGWQFVNVWALVTLAYGHTDSRPGQPFVLAVNLGIVAVLTCFALNLLMTVSKRRQRHMYISLWFYLSSAIVVPILQLVSNLAIPVQGYESISLFSGMADGFVQSWGRHCIEFYMVLMPAMGLMYYFVPKASGQAVVHYRMAILQFWSMSLLGVFAATRWLHYTATPEWITSLGMLAGLVMFLPMWVGVSAGWAMLRGPNKELAKSPILQLFLLGIVFYAVLCLDTGVTSIKSLSGWSVFTDWDLAHSYCMVFGVAGMFSLGAVFWMVPQLFHRPLFNKDLLRLHVFVAAVGAVLLIVPTYFAGYLQGAMGRSADSSGTLNYPEFIDIVAAVKPFWWATTIGAVVVALSMVLLAVNYIASWAMRDRKYRVRTTLAPKLTSDFEADEAPHSDLEGKPVLGFGIKLDRWKSLAFHRGWERSPQTFAWLITASTLFACVLLVLPTWAASQWPSEEAAAKPYTPLELAGRAIYVREGCASCHTQTVRPLLGEVERYGGEYTNASQFQYDRPTQWSTRRIGPDLGREGGRQNAFWHLQHLRNPQAENEASVMPKFDHLADVEYSVDWVRELLRNEAALGVSYDEALLADDTLSEEDRLYGEVTELESALQKQAEAIAMDMVISGGPAGILDKEVVALIAYLQRLGVAN